MESTHAEWIADCADRCVEYLRSHQHRDEMCLHLHNVAHQIAQARPSELREFVECYPQEKALVIPALMVLAWRIVRNEYKSEMAKRASDEIMLLCDVDEWEHATEAFFKKPEKS